VPGLRIRWRFLPSWCGFSELI